MKHFLSTTLFLCSILMMNGQTLTNYFMEDGLIDDNVICLTVDDLDGIWFGTQQGASYLDIGGAWTNYSMDVYPDMIDNNITAIEVDSYGNLWLGTDFGINKYDFYTWTSFTEDDGLGNNKISDIIEDENGDMWFATNDGFSIWDGTEWTNYDTSNGLPFGGVNRIEFDADGIANLCSGLGGLILFDGTEFEAITEDEGLLNDRTSSVAFDSNGDRWIGNNQGISVFNEENYFLENHTILLVLPEPDTLNPVEDIVFDNEGNAWTGIYVDYLVTEGGVSMFDGSEWISYEEDDGLAGPRVRQLAVDSDNNVWVATSTGVTKISDIPISVNEMNSNVNFSLYPNPAENHLTYNFTGSLTDYTIFDSLGKVIRSGNLLGNNTIDISSLQSGLYLFSTDQGTKRFIKK